ncbi:hypothetical protein ACSVH2_14145, partial [Flavobacterium sp. RSB2_4_14]|uniref:hypothetical protein n=1 Tax=Flavobacterium sp. RSB2_4_14 TaxID=3447665 RepID=UPI003F31E382
SSPVVINNPNIVLSNSCDYTNQAALDTAFSNWLASFSVTGGCNPIGTIQGNPLAPNLCQGGVVCVTYDVHDTCYQGSVTSKFTVLPR